VKSIRAVILSGLIADRGGEAQISTAMRVSAEIIASDLSLLVTFSQAIKGVILNNPQARTNPKALANWTAIRVRRWGRCRPTFSVSVRTALLPWNAPRGHCGHDGIRWGEAVKNSSAFDSQQASMNSDYHS